MSLVLVHAKARFPRLHYRRVGARVTLEGLLTFSLNWRMGIRPSKKERIRIYVFALFGFLLFFGVLFFHVLFLGFGGFPVGQEDDDHLDGNADD